MERRKTMKDNFNWDFWIASQTGEWLCRKCGAFMHFEDEAESIFFCDDCGNSVDIEDYGTDDEDYDTLYRP